MFQSIRNHLTKQLAKRRSCFGQVKELPLGDVVPLEVVEPVVGGVLKVLLVYLDFGHPESG
jgi:hypothetical protein